MTGTIVLARLTFHEARRSKILLVAVLLSLIFLVVYGLGINFIHVEIGKEARMDLIDRSEIFNFLTMAGLYVVNFLTVMMSVLTSVGTISGEIASGTIHTLVSKPVRRWEIMFGKWLGYGVMIFLYLALLAGGVLGIGYVITGYLPPNPLRGIGLMGLNALMLLSVSFVGGAFLSTLTNGVLVFGLFGIAFVGGWIEQFGSFLDNQTAIQIGILSSLLMPSEAIWKRVAFEMQSPLVSALGGFSPFSAASIPSPFMIGYTVIYTGVMVLLAMIIFDKRDL